jgi:hypothetical protein
MNIVRLSRLRYATHLEMKGFAQGPMILISRCEPLCEPRETREADAANHRSPHTSSSPTASLQGCSGSQAPSFMRFTRSTPLAMV